ncbi:MAG TPA: DUF5131 family protein [Phototrophicaceae bacterium]|nr:DUF5131 family protein [Phototrophicaceae bacterium]
MTKIPWTDEAVNFYSWNCTPVGKECVHCFAKVRAGQFGFKPSAGADFIGVPVWRDKAYDELRKVAPGSTVFINTHSDTFHPQVPVDYPPRIFSLAKQRRDLLFLILTKRPEMAAEYGGALVFPPNLWMGVSVGIQSALHRLDVLRSLPVTGGRFVSFEPLLEDLGTVDLTGINWVIVGAETGEVRRPFDEMWGRALRDQCQAAAVPFWFKSCGGMFPDTAPELDGQLWRQIPEAFRAHREQHRVIVETQQTALF